MRFHIKGTIQKTYLADVDEVFEGEDEADAYEAAMQSIIESQAFNHDDARYEWVGDGPVIGEVEDE